MSARTALIEYLESVVASDVTLQDIRVVPTVRDVGELSKPVLIIKTNSLSKIPQAPRAGFLGNFTATLVSPFKDLERAEDDLEDRLEVLLPLLFSWGLVWSSADQARFDEDRICYDIHIQSVLNS
jgi:hypothetical protein